MANKAGHRRFGSVRKLPSGRYQARYLGPDGVMRNAPETFERKGDADRWLVLREAEIAQGEWIDPDAGKVTVAEYAASWIKEHPKLAVTTREGYERHLRDHVTPTLGKATLGELSSPRIRRWRHGLLTSGVSESQTAKAYRFLRAVLNTAVSDRFIRYNPCNIKGAGIERSEERPVATIEQVAGLAAAIQDRYRLMVLLACFASLRYGELTGLRREHVDLEPGVVRVAKSLIQPSSAPMFDGDPKSRAGRRPVHLPPMLIPAVKAHLDTYVGQEPGALLFVGPKGGRPRRSNFHRIWDKARKQVGVPELHFHDLRHTGNTFAAATGASLKDLMARMGHASSRAAMVYQHATEKQGVAIAKGLDAVVAELVKGGPATTGQKT